MKAKGTLCLVICDCGNRKAKRYADVDKDTCLIKTSSCPKCDPKRLRDRYDEEVYSILDLTKS